MAASTQGPPHTKPMAATPRHLATDLAAYIMIINIWQQRSKRERCLLILLLSIVMTIASYQGLYLPWQQHQQTLKANIQQQKLKWRWLYQHSYALRPAHTLPRALQAKTLFSQISAISPNARTTLQTQDATATITITSIPYPALVQLLAKWHNEGLNITALGIEQTDDGTVTSHVSLHNSKH